MDYLVGSFHISLLVHTCILKLKNDQFLRLCKKLELLCENFNVYPVASRLMGVVAM